MSLDIYAYKKLTPAINAKCNDHGEYDDEIYFDPRTDIEWTKRFRPGHTEGLDVGVIYRFESKFWFRAGTYSSYGVWRNQLENLATGSEFNELIEFSSTEGVIGPVVAAKLLKDFNARMADAEAIGGNLFGKYEYWRHAFEMAADGGAVLLG